MSECLQRGWLPFGWGSTTEWAERSQVASPSSQERDKFVNSLAYTLLSDFALLQLGRFHEIKHSARMESTASTSTSAPLSRMFDPQRLAEVLGLTGPMENPMR